MDITTISLITTLALDVLGGIAFVISLIALKKKGKSTKEAIQESKPILEIAKKANEAAQNAFIKICHKNKVSTVQALEVLKKES